MRAKFTVVLTLLLVVAITAMASDIKLKKPGINEASYKVKGQALLPLEPMYPLNPNAVNNPVADQSDKIFKTTASTHRQFGTSGNGFGWLNPMARAVDRYVGIDNPDLGGSGDNIDFLLMGYRGDPASEIDATEISVATGLSAGTFYTYNAGQALTVGLTGNGGRYPSVVALDRPIVSYNFYVSGDASTTPAISHPYACSDYGTYGAFGGTWTQGEYRMDNDWLHPKVNQLPTNKENRLWNGTTSAVKASNGTYYWVGVYDTWFLDAEASRLNYQNDNTILRATSADPSADWTEDTTPVVVDPNVVSIPRRGVMLNSSGFGAIVGPGHLGWHDPDSGYYYVDTKITYSTTTDYGNTWAAWDTVSFADLGFPMYQTGVDEDTLIHYWKIEGTDTVWTIYVGPTFMGTNFDMDVLVDESSTVYVIFNSLWGRPGDSGWYPYPYYSGVYFARKLSGQAWEAAQIAYNNGVFEGDEQIEGMSSYFFDTEPKLAIDEQGHLYANWLDHRRTGLEVGTIPRYTAVADGGAVDFKTDIYASHSINGGAAWSEPINCTNTISTDEYELKTAASAANQETAEGSYGRIWFGYSISDLTGADPQNDAYVDRVNNLWIAESDGFNPPAAIGGEKPTIAGNFVLRQNYPNPFNPNTRIEFTPHKSGKAILSVYSITGQKIADLYHANVTNGETVIVDFDGGNLAAGVYFYRLTLDDKVEVKKMALVK